MLNLIVILNLFQDLSCIRLCVDLWQNTNVTDDRFRNKFRMTILIHFVIQGNMLVIPNFIGNPDIDALSAKPLK